MIQCRRPDPGAARKASDLLLERDFALALALVSAEDLGVTWRLGPVSAEDLGVAWRLDLVSIKKPTIAKREDLDSTENMVSMKWLSLIV